MRKIESFQITRLTLAGFKCYQEPVTFFFANPTVITGGNGRGKSTIADAIAFAVTGLPFFGERGIDRLHCETAPDLLVQMAFTDETGTSHELARSRRGDRMTITYDGCEVRQKDLAELFGEKDAFLSIFNPLYFIEELGEDGKRLLERYLPSVRHEEVLAQLGEPICTRLAGEELLSPEVYLRNKREELRTLEKELTYTAGQRDAIAAQRRDSEQESVRLNREIAALESELKTLEQRRCEGLDMAALEETLMETSERYSELLHEPIPAADTAEVDHALREVQAKRECRLAEVYQSKYTQPVLDATAKVKELGGRYKRQTALLKGFRAGSTCPACLRTVSEQELPAVQAALRDALTETVAEGKNVKAQLAELTALEAKAEAVFQQFKKEDEQTFTERCQELARQRESLVAAEKEQAQQRQSELEQLEQRIRELTALLHDGALSADDSRRMEECRETLRDRRAELAAAEKLTETAPEEFDRHIAEVNGKIQKAKQLLGDVAAYAAKRAELLFAPLRMNRVQISLFDVVKSTGEVKDVFCFTYNGRRYDRLSLSEKIRAGLELSELMRHLTGRRYPVFIDNMESVDDLANVRPNGQIILAKCVHGAALTVRPVNDPPMSKVA